MSNKYVLQIVDCCFLEVGEAIEHNKLQLWIARVFKLKLEKLFYYEMKVVFENCDILCINDMLVSNDGTWWGVTHKADKQVKIRNVKASHSITGLYGTMAIVARAHSN